MLLKIPHCLSERQATVPQATVPHALMAKVLRSVIHSLSLYLDDAPFSSGAHSLFSWSVTGYIVSDAPELAH